MQKFLVVSDCWLAGKPLRAGELLDLDPALDADAKLIRELFFAGRIIHLTAAAVQAFKAQMTSILTARECQVLELCRLSDKEIARRLKISAGTVSEHFQNIFSKLGIRGRPGLASFWSALNPLGVTK